MVAKKLTKQLIALLLGCGLAAGARTDPEPAPEVPRPGDFRDGYEQAGYETRSQSLSARQGQPAPLLEFVASPPLGLPAVPVPENNTLTAEKVSLGRKLFYDRRLSPNATISCAMCHVPEHGFTHNEMRTAVGIFGRSVRRNAPTIYNTAYQERLFHDGREHSLENQVWAPLLAANEMGNVAVGVVIEKLERLADYAGLFEAAFGRGPGMETIGMALASYERTLVSADSPFDRWYYGQQADALNPGARRGFALFAGKAGCSACHLVGPEWALFTDQRFHNTGIGVAGPRAVRKLIVAPGTELEVAPESIEDAVATPLSDLGRYEVTGIPADRWKYRTPGLRNVALTAPYMHDGSLPTLEAVVRFYAVGGIPNDDLDPLVRPLNLSAAEIGDLVAFLEQLTGSNVAALVADAFAAPIGN